MLVTLFGITIDVSPEQPENASSPMLVTPSGMTSDVSPEQPENAPYSMLVTLSGMMTFPFTPVITVLPSLDNRRPLIEE